MDLDHDNVYKLITKKQAQEIERTRIRAQRCRKSISSSFADSPRSQLALAFAARCCSNTWSINFP